MILNQGRPWLLLALLLPLAGPVNPAAARPASLSDEDILNPKRLIFNRSVPFTDSFDGSSVGQIFVSKRSILGHVEQGVLGEPGSPRHRQACLLFCPVGTKEIDATYLYFIEKKGECTIGARAIGWAEFDDRYSGVGNYAGTFRVRYTSAPQNITFITVNGTRLKPLPGQQIAGPYGSNYKYFPRNRNFLGFASTDGGFITDLIYFDGQILARAAAQGTLEIAYPHWQPSRHLIQGEELQELQKLLARCQS